MFMKKFCFTMATIALFAIGFAASDDSEERKELIGDYEIRDSNGTIWHLKLSDGDRATLKTQNMSDDDVVYGKWYPRHVDDEICVISFRDFYAGTPPIEFPNGQVWSSEDLSISNEWYLYHDWRHRKSKNPNTRLKVMKK